MKEALNRLIGRLETRYQETRLPQLWGTPEISLEFFSDLKELRLREAWQKLVAKERTTGNPNSSPELKAMATLVGATFQVLEIYPQATLRLFTFSWDSRNLYDLDSISDQA